MNQQNPNAAPEKRVPTEAEIARAEREAVAAMLRGEKPAAPRPAGAPAAAEAPEVPAEPAEPAEPSAPRVLEPSIRFSEHDDSVYRGSLNAVTGEGYDPCHDEQLAPLTSAETVTPPAEETVPGLQLSWTGSDVVRGLVMSEVLNRK